MKKILTTIVTIIVAHLATCAQDVYYPHIPVSIGVYSTNLPSLKTIPESASYVDVQYTRATAIPDGSDILDILEMDFSDFPFVTVSLVPPTTGSSLSGTFRLSFSALPSSVTSRRFQIVTDDETIVTFLQVNTSGIVLSANPSGPLFPHPTDMARELTLSAPTEDITYYLYRDGTNTGITAIQTGTGQLSFGTVSTPGRYTVYSSLYGMLPTYVILRYFNLFSPGDEYLEELVQNDEIPVSCEGEDVILYLSSESFLNESSYATLFEKMNTLGIPGKWPAGEVPVSCRHENGAEDMTITFSFPLNNSGVEKIYDTGFYICNEGETLKFRQPSLSTSFSGNNYIGKRTYTSSGGTTFFDDVSYYDGFGYLDQTVSVKAFSPTQSIVRPVVYDSMRHQDAVSYLPFSMAKTDASYVTNAVAGQRQWYAQKDARPYAETTYETGIAGRPISRMREGMVYADSVITISHSYGINDGSEGVLRLAYAESGSGAASVTPSGYHPANTLSVTRTINENRDTSFLFKDALGLLVLSRRVDEGVCHDTYYIYDRRDSLACIIQPEGAAMIAPNGNAFFLQGDFADKWCFTYEYDAVGNLITHHIPGGGRKQTIYDARRRPVLTTDPEMLNKGYWRYTQYDAMDRVVEEGLCKTTYSIASLRSYLYNYTNLTNMLYGKVILHTYDYYNATNTSQTGFLPISGVVSTADWDKTHTRTLLRSERVYEAPTISSFISQPTFFRERKYFYDYRGRPIQIIESDSDGSTGRYSYKYDFIGNILISREEHSPHDAPAAILTIRNTYSDRGILLSSTASANGMEHTTSYVYDDLGRLIEKTSNEDLSEQYAYNLQGWQTRATATILGDGDDYDFWDRQDLYYDGTGNRRYDGKLAQSHIFSGEDSHQEELHTNYLYDHLGRLVLGETLDNDSFPVASEQLSYDRNGNIASISRILGTESEAVPDTRDYFGNRLSVLVEDETDYTFEYDLNGAMTYDGKKNRSITRNILGLPCLIEDGRWDVAEISYLSDGTKRYTIADNSEGPRYYGSFIYAYDEGAGETQLESIGHSEGRFAATSYTSGHEPVFSNLHHVTDRLGSVVAVVDLDSVGNDGTDAVLEGNGYTPFGERFAIGDFPKMHLNRFRFNGKEHLNRFGLPYIDYGARYYDPTTARWQRPDPMADKYPDTSPYAFCGNDPVNFVDPQGDTLSFSLAILQNRSVVQKVIDDLNEKTGLVLFLDGSYNLVYKKDQNGNAIITKKNEKEMGSKTARTMLINAITDKETVKVFAQNNYLSKGKGNTINIDGNQIDSFITGTSQDLNQSTLGYAMTFLHELGHTSIGGGREDEEKIRYGFPGSNVEYMNIIRAELGPDYGVRLSYVASSTTDSTSFYLPFGQDSFISIYLGITPTHHFIKYYNK